MPQAQRRRSLSELLVEYAACLEPLGLDALREIHEQGDLFPTPAFAAVATAARELDDPQGAEAALRLVLSNAIHQREASPLAGREELLAWTRALSAADQSAAIAAAGVLTTAYERKSFGFGTPVPWRMPQRAVTSTDPSTWADAWRRELGNKQPRLACHAPLAERDWVLRTLCEPNLATGSVFFESTRKAPAVGWTWPLVIGHTGDDETRAMVDALDLSKSSWLGGLVKLRDVRTEEPSCDVLLLPSHLRESLSSLSSLPVPVRADVTLVTGAPVNRRSLTSLDALWSVVETGSVASVNTPPLKRPELLSTFMRGLSHDQPLDVALAQAAHQTGSLASVEGPLPVLDAFRPTARAAALGVRIAAAKPKLSIKLSPRAASSLNVKSAPRPEELAGRLQDVGSDLSWSSERHGATTLAEVAAAVEPVLDEENRKASSERWIQAEVADGDGNEAKALFLGSRYRAAVWIGPKLAGALRAVRPLDETTLPPSRDGHELTLVFSEPTWAPVPQSHRVRLPPSGASQRCTFDFVLEGTPGPFEARIVVLYENRILQTALLRGDVAEPGQPGTPLRFGEELMVRRGLADLRSRRRFEGAMLLNHTALGEPRMTAIRDGRATLIPLSGLDTALKSIDAALAQLAVDDDIWSQPNQDAVRDLAIHGRSLYDAIRRDAVQGIDLDTARSIQVVAARPDARFPIEVVYEGEPPGVTARLCPKAKDAIKTGACKPGCGPTDEIICPMAFWCTSRVLERHAFVPGDAKAVDGSQFALLAEPTALRRKLDPLSSALLAAAERVDAERKGSIAKLEKALKGVVKKPERVDDWPAWLSAIKATAPGLLVLVAHCEEGPASTYQLEIGKDARVLATQLTDRYVRIAKNPPPDDAKPPIVFLLACSGGAPEVPYQSLIAYLRGAGAALVLSSSVKILGRYTAPLVAELLQQLKSMSGKSNRSFGELMRDARRKLFLRRPMLFSLLTYGDADWRLS